MLHFNDLEIVEENVSRKRNMVIVNSDDEDIDVGSEAMSVLLGLTENMALD
jgi:hypothetical protein